MQRSNSLSCPICGKYPLNCECRSNKSYEGIIAELVSTNWKSYVPQDGLRQINIGKSEKIKSTLDEIIDEMLKKDAKDNVSKPAHYASGKIECIDVITQVIEGMVAEQAFYTSQVIKYIFRYDKKGGVEDVKKCSFYVDRLIKHLEKQLS